MKCPQCAETNVFGVKFGRAASVSYIRLLDIHVGVIIESRYTL
jgi:hypothetical protein